MVDITLWDVLLQKGIFEDRSVEVEVEVYFDDREIVRSDYEIFVKDEDNDLEKLSMDYYS